MTIENDPSARMQFVGMGELTHPGACMVCGSGNCEEGYVKLGVYYEYEGEMYLCLLCVKQAAEIIGCLTPEESQLLRDQSEHVANAHASILEKYEKANERLAAYDTVLAGINVAVDDSGGVVGIPISEKPAAADAVNEKSVEGPADSKSEPVKPVKKSGRGNPAIPAKPNRSNEVSI